MAAFLPPRQWRHWHEKYFIPHDQMFLLCKYTVLNGISSLIIILQKLCLPCAYWCGVTIGWILSLAREIAAMMLNCGYEFQYGYCHVAFAIFHQFLNSADTISQNQTPVINPRDLKKKSIVLNFCLLFVPQS